MNPTKPEMGMTGLILRKSVKVRFWFKSIQNYQFTNFKLDEVT